MATTLNTIDQIEMQDGQVLNRAHLNNAFRQLFENDLAMMSDCKYWPNIWECKWYNDDTIDGYSTGNAVWRNCIQLSDFVENCCDLVMQYTEASKDLQSYLRPYKPMTGHTREIFYLKYCNVISGFANEEDLSKQIKPMLFDVGDYNKPLEMYVSKVDHNKAMLSDTTSWQKVIFNSTDDLTGYVGSTISSMLEQHVKDYHFEITPDYNDGALTGENLSILVNASLSNLTLDSILDKQTFKSHESPYLEDGFDCVKRFEVRRGSLGQMDWYREWNSGYLEQGGIIRSSGTSPYVQVALQKPYDYNLPSSPSKANFYDLDNVNLYFGPSSTAAYSPASDLKKTSHYVIAVTPCLATENYESKFPADPFNNKNKTFLTAEVFNITNTGFRIMKNFDTSPSADKVQYYQYYTAGYTVHVGS